MNNKDMKFSKAIKRLEVIMKHLEEDEVDIDLLPELASEAAKLIKLCKSKLTSTETELKTILEDIEKQEEQDEDEDIDDFEEDNKEEVIAEDDIDKTEKEDQLPL